jgi:hypothetical protein
MNFGRISTSKCRGTLQKMGYCAPTPPRSPGPCYMQGPEKTSKKMSPFFSKKRLKKKGGDLGQAARARALGRVPCEAWTRTGQGTRAPHGPRPGQGPAGLVASPFWGTLPLIGEPQKGGSFWGQGPPPLPHELAHFLKPLGGSPQPP